MVSEDLIIGMELNFLKTKRKTKEKKKKTTMTTTKKKREKKKERKKEQKETERREKHNWSGPEATFLQIFFAKSSVATFETVLEQKSKHTTG